MTLGKRCDGLHLYNYMTQRNDIELKLDYKKVKEINNPDFFLKNEEDIINLDNFKQSTSHLPNKFKDAWVNYLDKNLWLSLLKFKYKEKTYRYYSCGVIKQDALEHMMLKYTDNIKTLIL